jgi:hypothetical protein
MVDTPTNNFATFNPLSEGYANPVLSEGNLKYAISGANQYALPRSTIGMSSGKWYWECYVYNGSAGNGQNTGIVGDVKASGQIDLYSYSPSIAYFWHSGNSGDIRINGSTSQTGIGVPATGDIVGFALDMESGTKTIQIYLNGSAIGSAATYTGDIAYYTATYNVTANWQIANFGQDSSFAGNKTAQGNQDSNDIGDFYYEPPTGFLALCTENLPEPAVIPSEHFEVLTYTGDGNSTQTLTTSFQPDFIWNKMRNVGYYHRIYDSVRGLSNQLVTNTTAAENAATDYGHPTATTSTSLTFGQGTDSGNLINATLNTGVFWNWKAGGTAVLNENGTIDSQVSANVDAGFSIVSYTGNATPNQTVGHGLSQDVEMVIVKNRDDTDNWRVWHTGLTGNTYYLGLNQYGPEYSSSTVFNGHSSTTFTVGNDASVNATTEDLIAYCFHSVDGYSKCGSYTGNGSADGTFVYTGFRPAWIMLKNVDTSDDGTDDWIIRDVVRDATLQSGNPSGEVLVPNRADPAGDHRSAYPVDILSNGFKIRNTSATYNWNNDTIVFLAIAEHPFKYSNAR